MIGKPRILIIEDNRDLATEMTDFLQAGGINVELATDGITGLYQAVVNEYDAIILDLMLPGMDGMTVFKHLRHEVGKETPVLMLTARDTLEDKIAGLDAGADDYMVKPAELREVEARVRALIRRAAARTSKSKLQIGDLLLDRDARCVYRAALRIELPPVQYKLMELLMSRHPQLVPREDIEQLIWGEARPDSDALRAHMHMLRALIDKPFDKPLLRTVRGVGYQLLSGDEAGN